MASPRKEKITPRSLMDIKMLGDVQVAPDGVRVAFSVSEMDWDENRIVEHLYVTQATPEGEPRQVTRGRDGEIGPRWSPDGKWLAFLTTREDEQAVDDDFEDDEVPKTQIWLLPMDGLGGEAEKLTDAPEGVGAYDWLPDSTGVAYLAQEPRPKPLQTVHESQIERKDDAVVEREEKFRHQIWQIALEDKKAKLVHPGDFGIGELAVSPDGDRIAFTTNYTGEENDYHKADLWIVERATGRLRQMTDGPGGKFHPVWKSDGAAILFVRPLDPSLSYSQLNLFAVALTDAAVTHLTADFSHDLTGWHGVWFDAAGALYVSVALGTATAIYKDRGDGFVPVVQNEEHIHSFHIAPGGGIAYVASDAEDVPDLYWLPPDAEEAEPLTDLNESWYEKHELAPTALVSWQSQDGLLIEGLLTYPIGYDPELTYPLILSLHGGPHGRALQALTPYTSSQVYAAEGYAVLLPNYRGSEGYGDAFCTANRADLGGGDYQDILAGVDWAIAQGIADPARLGITGSSYGGYLTNWAIGHTDRFKAAISKFGIFSLHSDFANSHAPRWELEYLDGFPWDKPGFYTERSPAAYVKDIETPVLILHGEGDPNTFISNSQEMYNALRLLGKPVQYVHYPREGHGFFEPQHRLDEVRRCLAWFDRYVRGGGEPAVYRLGNKIRQGDWELTVVGAEVTKYAGRAAENGRYVEVAFILRDIHETGAALTLGPGDVSLTRGLLSTGRSGRPVGLPIDVLGEKVLAEGQGWRFAFAPAKEQRGLAAPIALTFRITNVSGTFALAIKDFPPVTIDIPAADEKDDKKEKD